MNYVFDIDGTLTPSRLPIDPEFRTFFLNWVMGKNVYLLTGSDYEKSLEQVGSEILENVTLSFNNSGNVHYKKGKEIYRNNWLPPSELIDLLNSKLSQSKYPIRTGTHIEKRVGMVNFSIIGRDCSQEQRIAYFNYDLIAHEREKICAEIREIFPELDVSIGGQISIDIHPKGKNKSQILNIVSSPIYFFGDRTEVGGNDYAIASKLTYAPNRVFQVSDWQHTYSLLKSM